MTITQGFLSERPRAVPLTAGPAVVVWLAFAVATLALAIAAGPGGHVDPDDALRLVEVRDLLAGQSWFDMTQHRLGPPPGLWMHWSRVVDAPLALAIGFLSAVTTQAAAERLVTLVWPLLPLLPALAAIAAIARSLAGEAAAPRAAMIAVIMAATNFPALWMFLPRRIDHHNLQLALSLCLVASLLARPATARIGVLAGLAAATALAIGLETLPVLAMACAAVLLLWCLRADETFAFAKPFFAVFAGAGTLLFLATTAPSLWRNAACDAISPAWLVPLDIFAGGFLVAASRCSGLASRCLLALLLAAVSLASLATTAPLCLGGPYAAVDPVVATEWMAGTGEAKSILRGFADAPGAALALVAVPALALAAAVAMASRPGEGRRAWALVAALLGMQLALTLWQVRGAPLANLLASAALGAVVAGLSQHWAAGRQGLAVLVAGLLASWPAAAGLSFAATQRLPGAGQQDMAAALACVDKPRLEALSALPPGMILSDLNLASAILAASPHSVLAGPYHRAGPVILDAIHALSKPPDVSRAIIGREHVDYLVVCPLHKDSPEGSLSKLILDGHPPAWLRPLPLPGLEPARAFAVTR